MLFPLLPVAAAAAAAAPPAAPAAATLLPLRWPVAAAAAACSLLLPPPGQLPLPFRESTPAMAPPPSPCSPAAAALATAGLALTRAHRLVVVELGVERIGRWVAGAALVPDNASDEGCTGCRAVGGREDMKLSCPAERVCLQLPSPSGPDRQRTYDQYHSAHGAADDGAKGHAAGGGGSGRVGGRGGRPGACASGVGAAAARGGGG